MKIFLNLLAATAGGQISRARAFLDRFPFYAPNDELIVCKERDVLADYISLPGRQVIDVPIGLGKLKAIRRTCWENMIMPTIVHQHAADLYLTFSHYLPQTLTNSLPSVVGVSNLAPFSRAAQESEAWPTKLKMAVLRRTIGSSCQRATRVLALSETCRNVLTGCGIPIEKISVASNGVDAYWSEKVPASDFAGQNGISRPFILYVSHFHRYKNHRRLIEAYSRLQPSIRKKYQLVLVGKPYDHACYQDIRALVDRLVLSDDVILVPGVDGENLRKFYQLARLFVFPSLIENSPNILLEAMMAGAPVAASNCPPMPEFGGDAISYFDPLVVSTIAEAIERLLEDQSSLERMRPRSREQAGRYSWDVFVPVVIELCQSAIVQHRLNAEAHISARSSTKETT